MHDQAWHNANVYNTGDVTHITGDTLHSRHIPLPNVSGLMYNYPIN